MTANEEIQLAQIRHAVYLQRYSKGTVRKIIALLDRLDSKVTARLQRENLTTISRVRLDRLLDGIREINAQAYAVLKGELRSEIRELAKYEAGFQQRVLITSIPVSLDVVVPAAAQLYAAVEARPFQGRLLKEWFTDLEANTFKRVRTAIRMGYVEGRTTDQIVRELRGRAAMNYRDGILAISKRGAEATVRTAVAHTANVAREKVFEENAGLIKGIKWVSTLDGRTSAVCRGRDGTVYPVSSGPRPPAHINCRSTTTPVLKSWKELGISLPEAPEGTRASMDGQVPGAETYNTWLKKQPVGFQDEVLGKTKGKLYRDGGLSLDRFTDASGYEYTLDELRIREAKAFERAGL